MKLEKQPATKRYISLIAGCFVLHFKKKQGIIDAAGNNRPPQKLFERQ